MNENKAMVLLKKKVAEYPTQKDCAKAMSVHPSYLSEIMKGKRGIPDRIARFIGLEAKTEYTKI